MCGIQDSLQLPPLHSTHSPPFVTGIGGVLTCVRALITKMRASDGGGGVRRVAEGKTCATVLGKQSQGGLKLTL